MARKCQELGKQRKVGKMSEMLKIFSVQNMQLPFETLKQKRPL